MHRTTLPRSRFLAGTRSSAGRSGEGGMLIPDDGREAGWLRLRFEVWTRQQKTKSTVYCYLHQKSEGKKGNSTVQLSSYFISCVY
jgi:hypothetical protein